MEKEFLLRAGLYCWSVLVSVLVRRERGNQKVCPKTGHVKYGRLLKMIKKNKFKEQLKCSCKEKHYS